MTRDRTARCPLDYQKYYVEISDHINISKDIEESLGHQLEWKEAAKATRFFTTKDFDLDSKELWKEAFDWFYQMCLKFKSTLKSIDTSLK